MKESVQNYPERFYKEPDDDKICGIRMKKYCMKRCFVSIYKPLIGWLYPKKIEKENKIDEIVNNNYSVVDFYMGKNNPTFKKASIHDVLNYNYVQLESKHNFIQWIFPLKDRSLSVPDAPIVSDDEVILLKESEVFHKNMKKALKLMLDFYGFGLVDDTSDIAIQDNFKSRSKQWITIGNHNYLRITRILRSLILFGENDLAINFFNKLAFVYNAYSSKIGSTAFFYWEDAVYGMINEESHHKQYQK